MEPLVLPSINLDALGARSVERTLLLPKFAVADMEQATKGFARLLAASRGTDLPVETAVLVEILARSLLLAASNLLWRPESVLSAFRAPRWEPWLERNCTILTLSRAGDARNHDALHGLCRTLGLASGDLADLRSYATTLAVASLVLQGRLPFVERPPDGNLN
jgi:hypothetical protein